MNGPSRSPRPSERDTRIGAIAIVAAGVAAIAIAILSEQLGLGEAQAQGTFGWKRAGLLMAGLGIAAGGALIFARPAPVSAWLIDARRRVVAWGPGERLPPYLALGLIGLLGLVLVWSRLGTIHQSFWHDEAYSVLNHTGIALAFGGHVLFNQLSWATTSLLGESEATHRLWSVLPGIATVGLGTWWAWRRIGIVAAVAFATIAVAAPLHLDVVTQARGYGLAMLAAMLMLIAADRLTRTYSLGALLGFLAAGLAGMWTLIFFAGSFVGQVISLLRWPRVRVGAIAVLVVGGVLTYVFLASRYGQVQGETIPLIGAALFERTFEWLVLPSFAAPFVDPGDRLIDIPGSPGWLFLFPLALLAVGLFGLWRRGQGGLVLLLLLPPLTFSLAFSIAEYNTVARHQLVLFPHILLMVAAGFDAVGRLLTRPAALRYAAIAAGTVAVVVVGKATIDHAQTRTIPLENFSEAARIARGTGLETIVTDSTRSIGLSYYLGGRLNLLEPEQVEALACDHDHEFVYIRHVPVPRSLWGSWAPASLDCLEGENATRVRVPQRARGSAIDVWIVHFRPSGATIADDVPFARDLGSDP